MSRTLTAADRKRLIKMASTMAVGSPERKAVLKGLSKSAASVDTLRRKAEDLFYDYNLTVGDEYEEYDGYSGRAMYGVRSPLAFEVFSRDDGPRSDLGKDMKRLGFMADNLGMGWIYYLPASGRMAGFQSKGLKKTKVASDSPILMPVRGGDELVMPANGTDFKLREVQKMIGGYVEVVYLRDGRIMLVDEEGLLKGLPLNRAASRMAGRPIVGNALVMPNDMFR